MSYNIRNGRGMDDVADFRRTAAVINKVCPDVVAVQEIDSVTGRSGGKDVLREIAGLTLMHLCMPRQLITMEGNMVSAC